MFALHLLRENEVRGGGKWAAIGADVGFSFSLLLYTVTIPLEFVRHSWNPLLIPLASSLRDNGLAYFIWNPLACILTYSALGAVIGWIWGTARGKVAP